MAIDSKEKLLSMLNFGDGSTLHTLFEADGSVETDDKQHLLDCYSGIAFQPIGGLVTKRLLLGVG